MTNEEYKEALREIYINKQRALTKLYIKFAFENKRASSGDKVTDHCKTILVDKITVEEPSLGEKPQCVYHGVLFTKSGNLSKNKRGACYELNIEKINDKSV